MSTISRHLPEPPPLADWSTSLYSTEVPDLLASNANLDRRSSARRSVVEPTQRALQCPSPGCSAHSRSSPSRSTWQPSPPIEYSTLASGTPETGLERPNRRASVQHPPEPPPPCPVAVDHEPSHVQRLVFSVPRRRVSSDHPASATPWPEARMIARRRPPRRSGSGTTNDPAPHVPRAKPPERCRRSMLRPDQPRDRRCSRSSLHRRSHGEQLRLPLSR
ncbi:putative DNA-directed RNA polymerase II subunit RPB1-like [Iris pallida]|uniref:DNA-directed RNA polymerase II subunit RPB1-like n=1 Tax=Iris pallida TaxID=29817 RepID=A0AAX6FBE1_IRIPA|nr:putative DNA-directed RNA polymerase II subunit RPB1-like [Iris pallida]